MDRKKTIGLVMDYAIPGVIDGARAYAREHGLRIDPRWSVRADWMPERPGWDGALVHLIDTEGVLVRLRSLDLPVVHLGAWLPGSLPRVNINHGVCGALAVEEFRSMGLERVAMVDVRSCRLDRRCFLGARVAARKAGMQFASLPRCPRGEDLPEEVQWIAEHLATVERPCGLFLPHAGFAFSLLGELAERGLRVPEDVALIVIDKDVQRTAELASVPLTAVVPDNWRQGYEAARMVHRLMEGEPIGKRIERIAPAGIVRRESTGVETTRDPVVAKALHGIRERPLGHLSVQQLVAYTGVSRRTLELRFRRETGRTLHDAIMLRRIEEAKRLLKAGGLTVAEVAAETGYSSVHYFSTAFKREVGETPGKWRKGS